MTRTKDIKDGTITSTGDRAVAGLSHAVLIIWSILVIVPMVWVLLQSFKGKTEVLTSPFGLPETWHFSNYYTVWVGEGMGRSFLNTIFVVPLSSSSWPSARCVPTCWPGSSSSGAG